MKKKILFLAAGLTLAAVAGSFALFSVSQPANADYAMTELRVDNLSCGSCVKNIQNALGEINGIRSVDVSVTTGRSQVVFNPEEVETTRIAQIITDTGYPAVVLRQLSPEEYRNIQAEDAQLAKTYVAKVGNTLLGREEFDQYVDQLLAEGGLQNQPEARNQVIAQAWEGLLQRTLLLADAERNQVVVQKGEVELRLQQLRGQNPNFDNLIQARFGSQDIFSRRLKEDMTINRNIEEHVLAKVQDPTQRQSQFGRWYQQLVENTPILIYDPLLKQAAAGGGGCGSGCCGKS